MPRSVKFSEALRFWAKYGFINFGGPAGQIALLYKEVVDRRRWVEDHVFLQALNYCMLLPGPEAQQLSVYVGWRLHGIPGGVAAGILFILPSVFILLLLSWLAMAWSDIPAVSGFLYGIQPAVVAIVIEAVIRLSRKTLGHASLMFFALAAFFALRFWHTPFPVVVLLAGVGGLLASRFWPEVFRHKPAALSGKAAGNGVPLTAVAAVEWKMSAFFRRAARIIGIFFLLWAVPMAALWLWSDAPDILWQQALFFSRVPFVTFGGAYAVLSYVAEAAVNQYHWLTTSQMVHGLGLAESTPGPLIMVLQYVAFAGAWTSAGTLIPFQTGLIASLYCTYLTFLPSFMLVFLGAPYIEFIGRNRKLQAALMGITAAVVGVIANLSFFFGEHVLFPAATPDPFAISSAGISLLLLQRFKVPVQYLVLGGALAGVVWFSLRP